MPNLTRMPLDVAQWECTALDLLDQYSVIPPLVRRTSLSSSRSRWQRSWVSFRISPREQCNFDFQQLVSIYLDPAVRSLACSIDLIILSTAYAIIRDRDRTPYLPPLTVDNCQDNLCTAKDILNHHLASINSRNLMLSPLGERVLWTNSYGTQRVFDFNVHVTPIINDLAPNFNLAWQHNAISYAASLKLRAEIDHDELSVILEADIEIDVPNPGWIILFQEQS